MAKQLVQNRSAIAKRLKRRGIIESARGIETQELERLWEKYQNAPVIIKRKPTPKLSNFETVKKILDNFVEEFQEYFVGWYRDAWRYVPEIKYFYQRLDKDKINSDKKFSAKEVNVFFQPPSDWSVNDQFQMAPEDVPDYLMKLYDEYIL